MARGKRRDAFADGCQSADVEVKVHMLNINYGHNRKLMEQCPLLGEYAQFAAISREYLAKGIRIEDLARAVNDKDYQEQLLREMGI